MRGYTLIEAVTVLTLIGIGLSTLVPTARRWGDRAAVAAAREEVVGALVEARAVAVSSGGSRVRIWANPPRVAVVAGGDTRRVAALDARVRVRLTGEGDSIEVRYDGLGVGRFANQTVVFERGSAVTSLTVSSYGRVRRR